MVCYRAGNDRRAAQGTATRSKIKAELAAANRRILGAGALLLAAIVPAFRAAETGTWVAALALEALICLGMVAARHVCHGRVWRNWESSMQATLMRMAWCEGEAPVERRAVECPSAILLPLTA